MLGTLALIIGLSTLFFTFLLNWVGVNYIFIGLFVVCFNFAQWLFAPYLIDALYRTKKVSRTEAPRLYEIVERLSLNSNISIPNIMVAKVPIPNAFAYGSPLTGNKVAVTSKLLSTLESEEVEAVIGHELGHIKHRDVQVMMFVSILPALFYYVGYSLILSSGFNRRSKRDSGGLSVLLGFASIILYFVLTLFSLYLSRLREYHADQHSILVARDGKKNLSEALAKIAYSSEKMKRTSPKNNSLNSFKSLFISDPDSAGRDLREMNRVSSRIGDQKLVEEYLKRKITKADIIAEVFSTHPNMVKRLRELQIK